MKKKPQPRRSSSDLRDDQLDNVVGASRGRVEAYGDAIGNYNFRLEIDGVDAGQ